jgi:uncharacterized metal-binding protein YceD (DUF177 family)
LRAVTKPRFAVTVADLERGPKTVSWDLPVRWLEQALDGTEASPRDAGRLEAQLTLNGRDVLVTGTVSVQLTMPCVRTLEPVQVDLEPELFLLLEPSEIPGPTRGHGKGRMSGRASARRADRHLVDATDDGKGWRQDPVLNREAAARDTYDGEHVVLDEFIREFIVLDLPMAPHRTDLPSATDAGTTPALWDPGTADGPSVDPRLAPLVEIASRMRKTKE